MKKISSSAFLHAGRVGDVEHMKALLKADSTHLTSTDDDGRNALMHAVLGGHIDAVSFLLNNGCDPDRTDKFGFTAMHFAAQDHLPAVVELLLSKGASVDVPDEHGNTALFRATFNSMGRGDVIRMLIDAGADQNHKNQYGVSPRELAKSIANYPVIQWFKVN